MSEQPMSRRKSWGRRAWDDHGSLLIVLVLVMASAMAGSEWRDVKTLQQMKALIASYDQRIEYLNGRLKIRTDENIQLSKLCAVSGIKIDSTEKKVDEVLNQTRKLIEESPK